LFFFHQNSMRTAEREGDREEHAASILKEENGGLVQSLSIRVRSPRRASGSPIAGLSASLPPPADRGRPRIDRRKLGAWVSRKAEIDAPDRCGGGDAGSLPHKIDYIHPPPFLESDLNDEQAASGTNLMAILNLDIYTTGSTTSMKSILLKA
jgi:hypothetical protein